MKNFNVAWFTTNRNCNNNCSWCYAKNTLHSKKVMDFNKAKIAVDELKKRGVKKIVLIGGEPTIYPYFFDMISYIHERDIKVVVASNGRLFKNIEFAQKAKDAGVDRIDVSIKAIDEDAYFANTNAYGLREMILGYHNLKSVGIKTSASYVIVNNSKDEFDRLIDFLVAENFSSISLQFVKPVLSLESKEPIIDFNKMGKFVEYIYEKMERTGLKYALEIPFPICLIDESIFNKLVAGKHVTNCCHVPKGSCINFDESFRVLPCNHFAEFPFSEPVDFERTNSLDEIMESDIVKSFRKKARSYPSEKCINCNRWKICGGGCFTYWLMDNPNKYIK